MSSSRKKAIFRKFSRDWVAGYLPGENFARAGQVEMLDLDGKVVLLALDDLKWICYVRDFNSGEERVVVPSGAPNARSTPSSGLIPAAAHASTCLNAP